MLFVAIIGIIGGLIFASMAYSHHKDSTGEHKPWVITSAAFLLIGIAALIAFFIINPQSFTAEVLPSSIGEVSSDVLAQTQVATATPEAYKSIEVVLPATMPSWHNLAEFSGSSSTLSSTFNTTGEYWRLRWDLEPTGSPASFSFTVLDSAGSPVSRDATADGPVRETFYYLSGNFRVQVKSDNVKWNLDIDDRYTWDRVLDVDGEGDADSAPFSITGDQWRVTVQSEDDGMTFSVLEDGKEVAASEVLATPNEARLTKTGSFQVKVKSDSNWTLSIDQHLPGVE